jgi:hypothetical protein
MTVTKSRQERPRRSRPNIHEALEVYLEPVEDDLPEIGKELREIVL